MGVIKPQEINLDFTQNSYKDIVVKQNDVNSRSVIVTCTNNGTKCPLDRVAQTCNIKMETPDGRPIYNPTTILSDGRVQIDFTEQMVLIGGKVDAELEVVDATSQQIIHTMNLHIIIVSNVYPNDAIIASPEFDALNKALLAVQDCSELVESVHEIEENERIREENEAQRAQEFEEMKNAVANVDEHYNTIASTDVLGHVKVDNESIVIDENGVIRSGFGKVPDGVTYIDFDDSESIDYTPIDQVNGVKIYHTDDDKLMASWYNNGETKEIDLTSGSGGSSGEEVDYEKMIYSVAGVDKNIYPYFFAHYEYNSSSSIGYYDIRFSQTIQSSDVGQVKLIDYISYYSPSINNPSTAPTLNNAMQEMVDIFENDLAGDSSNGITSYLGIDLDTYTYYANFDLVTMAQITNSTYQCYRLDVEPVIDGVMYFPTNEDGSTNYGTAGQFAISTGTNKLSFVTIDIAEGGSY